MARKKMDVSSRPAPSPALSNERLPDPPPQPIELSNRPLTPWLRLAHVTRSRIGYDGKTQLRYLQDFELVVQFEGNGWIYADPLGGSLEVPAGYVAFIPPNYVHAWGADEGAHIAVHFDFHAQPKIDAMLSIQRVERLVSRSPARVMPRFSVAWPNADNPLIYPLVTHVRDLEAWKQKLLPITELWMRRAHMTLHAQLRFQEALSWALQTLADDAAHAGLSVRDDADPRILALLRELAATPQERPSVSELASRVHMGITGFRDAFIKATGRPPRRYLEEQRIERAARALIETPRKLYDIAESEGYEDSYHFSRIFKRVMGVSPRQFRRGRGK